MACRLRTTAVTAGKKMLLFMLIINKGSFFQIPSALRGRLSINTHSAVKVRPLRCSPKVALAVSLQPVRQLVSVTFHHAQVGYKLYFGNFTEHAASCDEEYSVSAGRE